MTSEDPGVVSDVVAGVGFAWDDAADSIAGVIAVDDAAIPRCGGSNI